LTVEEVEEVRKTIHFAKNLESQSPDHPATAAYFSHPIRVATFGFRMQSSPQLDTVLIGVMHNIFEVCDLDETALIKLGYRDSVAQAIRLLTIDREFEEDPDYLAKFYGNIEAHSANLSLIRCCDKLDNLMVWELFEESDFRTKYIDLALQFVAPMASRLSPEFGKYFEEVVEYSRKVGCQPDLKAQYEQFLQNFTS
jgi:(p)ppGpp synthase/HD superfamily hydrolase